MLSLNTAINKFFVDPLMEIREDWNWENDFWLDLSNAYLWNSDAKILDESSLPFPVFVATAYDSRNNKEFFPIENTLLYSGVPLDPRKLDKNAFMGGGFVQVSYLPIVVYSIYSDIQGLTEISVQLLKLKRA